MLGTVCWLALTAAALAQLHVRKRDAIDTTEAVLRQTVSVHERFPHAVLIGGNCGGSIISDKWILTAAHCSWSNNFVSRAVIAGTSNYLEAAGTTVHFKKLYIHPLFAIGPIWVDARKFGFKQIAAHWDLMLAELESPLKLDGVNMAAVALDGEPALPANLSVAYAGYGTKRFGGRLRRKIRVMEMQTISDAQCSSKLQEYNAEDMVCALGHAGGRDFACKGDSGSGLVSVGGSPRRLVGVLSWAEDDAHECRPNATVVFARVASARAWIKLITGI